MKLLQQMFCKHLWRTVKVEELERVTTETQIGNTRFTEVYVGLAEYQHCMRCPKTRVVARSITQ